MALRERLAKTLALFGRRQRKTWFGKTRAQLELRVLTDDELLALRLCLDLKLAELPGIEWVEINPYTRRVVIAHRADTVESAALLAALESAEHDACCRAASFRNRAVPFPADEERLLQLSLELGADAIGFVLGSALRLSPIPASRVAGTVASVAAIAKGAPKIRKSMDERLGPTRTDLFMSLTVAAGNGLAQRPIASLVDVAHRSAPNLWPICRRARRLPPVPSSCLRDPSRNTLGERGWWRFRDSYLACLQRAVSIVQPPRCLAVCQSRQGLDATCLARRLGMRSHSDGCWCWIPMRSAGSIAWIVWCSRRTSCPKTVTS